jgi:hypothetical protein
MNNRTVLNLVLLTVCVLIITPSVNAGIVSINSEKLGEIDESVVLSEENKVDLVILCPSEFAKTLEPLVKHKKEMGVKTRLYTLYEINIAGEKGYDAPEKVKYFIKAAYDQLGIKYVLLVGGYKKFPVRYIYNYEDWLGYPEPSIISDLYYADLYDNCNVFQTWDTNNNHVYGEWMSDFGAEDYDIDLRPDVFVGRLACRNKIEVRTMVRKIINYERNTYNAKWFKRILAIAGDTYPNKKPSIEGEENADKVIENMTGFQNTTLYTSDGSFKGTFDVIKAFNQGYGFVFFEGHANPQSWSTHKPNDHKWIEGLSTTSIPLLMNGYKMPIVVSAACHDGQFDVNIGNLIQGLLKDGLHYFNGGFFYHYTWIPECWTWKLTRKIGGGAIATIANTGLGMTKEDKESGEGAGDVMSPQFFLEYQKGLDILGEVWGASINSYLDQFPINWNTPAAWDYAYDAKTVQQWILFGDPSLKIGGYDMSTIK